MVAIVGLSGSGKSTPAEPHRRIPDTPSSGEITIDGEKLSGLSETTRRACGATRRDHLQFFNLLPTLSCIENVSRRRTFATGRGEDRRPRARAAGPCPAR
jgi:ABC-type lipoprotein export system ATPase subunit